MGWTGIDTFNSRNMCARKGNRQRVKKRTNNADTANLMHSTNTPPKRDILKQCPLTVVLDKWEGITA